MAAAVDALSRLDDAPVLLVEDTAMLAVFERHCQRNAFELPCHHGVTGDCNSCFLDHDYAMRRADDV